MLYRDVPTLKKSHVANQLISRSEIRRGAVVVEFAIISILLSVLILGMVEISRGIMVKESLSNAARDGARMAAKGDSDNAAITLAAREILNDNSLNGNAAQVTIAVTHSDSSGTVTFSDVTKAEKYDKISVTVSLPVAETYVASTFFLPKDAISSETVVMMRQ